MLAPTPRVHALPSSVSCPFPVSPVLSQSLLVLGSLFPVQGISPIDGAGKSSSIFDPFLEPDMRSPLPKIRFREQEESVLELKVPSGRGDRDGGGRGRKDWG